MNFKDADIPFAISDAITLRLATNSEIEIFKSKIKKQFGDTYWIHIESFDQRELKTRWFVVAFNGNNSDINLELVANLTTPQLHFGITLLYNELDQDGKCIGTSYHLSETNTLVLLDRFHEKRNMISLKELNKLRKYYNMILSDHIMSSHIINALKMYSSATRLTNNSALLTLSLFSIIESLIAHNPISAESVNSITHQIKNKMYLLSKRFENKVEHTEYFGNIKFQNLFKKLYGLRSNIAHGTIYDFTNKDYQCLKNLENVNSFLNIIVKELIKLSISDPQLIKDIKNC